MCTTRVTRKGRVCTKCHKWKRWNSFYKCAQQRSGHYPSCKQCNHTTNGLKWKPRSKTTVKGRECLCCHKIKPWSDFRKSSQGFKGYTAICKCCARRKNKMYRDSLPYKPSKQKDAYLKTQYGITWNEYLSLHKKQKSKCAICGKHLQRMARSKASKHKTAAVDHCHTTGRVRGLLCGNCNRGLGLLHHNTKLFKKAVRYLT